MDYLGIIMMLVSFGFFGWLIHKYVEKRISGLAASFAVGLTAILQLCAEATFDSIGAGYMVASLGLMFFSFVLMLIMTGVESRKPWAAEDRVLKVVQKVVEPFE